MYKLLLSSRYLRTRFIALASIISVMLGVATMIVVNSVMTGFSMQMKDRLRGVLADVIVETVSMDGAPDAHRMVEEAKRVGGDDIVAITPVVEVFGLLHFEFNNQKVIKPVTLIGIEPAGKELVGPLRDYLVYRNAQYEEGKLVRDAAFSKDEPLNWELSSEAEATRRSYVDRLQFEAALKDAEQDVREPGFGPRGAEPDGQIIPAEGSAPESGPSGEGGPVSDNEEGKSQDESQEESGVKQVDANGLDEQDPSQIFGDDPSEEPADPYAPADGRLYVGIGIVSFPWVDPRTHKTSNYMMINSGEDMTVVTVKAGIPDEVRFPATVVDIFKSGMAEYDSNLVFCNLDYLQKVRGMAVDDSVNSLHIKLKDYSQAKEVVQRLRKVFPHGRFQVKTWEEKQGPILEAVAVESSILNILLFLIIAVAGFGILAIFYMIVVEKTRDIGVLKSLGASSRGIMTIFLSYGLSLGVVGSGVGVVLGLLFVRYINEIEDLLSWISGRKVFDESIYYFEKIPTTVHPSMVVMVALGAMTIAVLASVLPARRAARLHPVEALRYE